MVEEYPGERRVEPRSIPADGTNARLESKIYFSVYSANLHAKKGPGVLVIHEIRKCGK